YYRPDARRRKDRTRGAERDLDVACMFASTSRERGLAIRSAPLRTLLFTALDLSRYSVGSMLSDFWHTFCRGHPRRARTMGRAKTPFLFVQIVDVGRTNVNCRPRDRVGRGRAPRRGHPWLPF